MRSMRRGVLIVGLCVAALSGPWARHARAQDGATLDQVRRMYQDALSQLKSAQDRKNELASENAKLTARIAELEKQTDADRQQALGEAERTYLLRARMAAWEAYMKQNPETLERWRAWLEMDVHPGGMWQLNDLDWPWE
jgi:septal ring factor EnvC (AmiA/AmiB activator)